MSIDIQRLNQRLESAQPSATYRIMDRVAERRAQGAKIISLCAGEPDFDTPKHVREAAIHAIEHGHTRYTQVQMHYRENGAEQMALLQVGDIFYASVGTEHVAHPQGPARILVIESEGSV